MGTLCQSGKVTSGKSQPEKQKQTNIYSKRSNLSVFKTVKKRRAKSIGIEEEEEEEEGRD